MLMTPEERSWMEARIGEWSACAAANRRIAATRQGPINRAMGLESVIRRLQARIDAAGPVVIAPDRVDESPVTVVAGDPFAGSARDRHLRSAAVCRMVGNETAARGFEALAAAAGDAFDLAPIEAPAPRKPGLFERMSAIAAASRIPQPPARDPVPFTAGPQMDMFG